MVRNFTSEDEGKQVMASDGENVGTITKTSGPVAHVSTDSGLSGSIRRRLGWGDDDEEYELMTSNVESISDDEVRLKKSL